MSAIGIDKNEQLVDPSLMGFWTFCIAYWTSLLYPALGRLVVMVAALCGIYNYLLLSFIVIFGNIHEKNDSEVAIQCWKYMTESTNIRTNVSWKLAYCEHQRDKRMKGGRWFEPIER